MDLTDLEFYVLCALPEDGSNSFRALLGSLRNAEIVFPADVAFEQHSEPEPISMSESDFCELLVKLASENLLEVMREEVITMKFPLASGSVSVEVPIATKYKAVRDFPVENISEFCFQRTGFAKAFLADPLNKERFGEFTIPDYRQSLPMYDTGTNKWEPYALAFFVGIFLLLSGLFVWWYLTDLINLTTFLVLVVIFWACGGAVCATGRKRRCTTEPVNVRRIRIVDECGRVRFSAGR